MSLLSRSYLFCVCKKKTAYERLFFFCKQKTAYEMRISDWSSDVCSSDLDAGVMSRGPRQEGDQDDTCQQDAATEAGDDAKIWWDLHITPSGGDRKSVG